MTETRTIEVTIQLHDLDRDIIRRANQYAFKVSFGDTRVARMIKEVPDDEMVEGELQDPELRDRVPLGIAFRAVESHIRDTLRSLDCSHFPRVTYETDRHVLKCWPEPFDATLAGEKRYEIRRDDRDFDVGDRLRLREWTPESETYTGRFADYRVIYLSRNAWGLPPGLVVMGIEPVEVDGA